MLPFLYDPKRNEKKENFVQEQLRIELYIPEVPREEEDNKEHSKRGVEVIQL